MALKGLKYMNIRRIRLLLLVAAVLSVMTACGSRGPESSKDSVVIAIGSEPETLDPTKGWGHGNSPIVQACLHFP